MSSEQPVAGESRAHRWYGRLINLYPGAFRDRYAGEMIRVFEESWKRISNRGATAQWRFWFHIICDLIRTLPGEWLAAMPLPTKGTVLGAGAIVSYFAIDREMMNLAFCLFFFACATACFAISIRPLRLRHPSLLLLAAALEGAGFWITRLLAGYGPNFRGSSHETYVLCFLTFLVWPCWFFSHKRLGLPWLGSSKDPTGWNMVMFKCTFGWWLVFVPVFSIQLIQPWSHFPRSYVWLATDCITSMIFCLFCPYLAGHLWVIWRKPDNISKPDPETRPA